MPERATEPRRSQSSPSSTAPERPARTGGGKNVRISLELYYQAEAHAELMQRSAQKQVEYWTQLGRHLEMHLNATDALALISGRKIVNHIELVSSAVPTPTSVLDRIEAMRRDGSLQQRVTAAKAVYEADEDASLIRKIDEDGHVSVGRLVDGQFVER